MNSAVAMRALIEEAAQCRRCSLWANATQTVFGEGLVEARVVIVGEQPGDQEDLAGRPFVGPAGQLFDRALSEAGIDRSQLYVTNAVKHFKNEPRGERRIHKKPDVKEVEICRWWLDHELDLIAPDLVVAMGATAIRALGGKDVSVMKARGRLFPSRSGRRGLVTVHPSFLLRLPDEAAKAAEYRNFVADLALIGEAVPAARLGAPAHQGAIA